MVNYAKWDNLQVSDDEEDTSSRRVGVTKLETPSRITFGGGGANANVISIDSPMDDGAVPPEHLETLVTPGAAAADAQGVNTASTSYPKQQTNPTGTDYDKFAKMANAMSDSEDEQEYFEDEAMERREIDDQQRQRLAGKSTETSVSQQNAKTSDLQSTRNAKFSENGGRETICPGADESSERPTTTLMWSQSREEVILSVVVPAGTKAKDVAVRCTSTNIEVACMTKQSANSVVVAKCLLSDRWTHPVDPEPKDDDDDDAQFGDWEVCDWEGVGGKEGERVVRVTVQKKNIGGSLVHWWKKGTEGGTGIDVSAITARKPGAADASSKIWNEATAAFKKRVADRVPIELDCAE